MAEWPIAAPRPTGDWTVSGGHGWAGLEPESGRVTVVDPLDDGRLLALRSAASAGAIVAYRIGRRAVVRHPAGFVKVVPPDRLGGLIDAHGRLCDDGGVTVPRVRSHCDDGRVELEVVLGTTLLERLGRSGDVGDVLDGVVDVVGRFHAVTADGLPCARLDDPRRWIDAVCRIDPTSRPVLERVAAVLPTVTLPVTGLVHGDLHDKNLLVSRQDVGVIDLDGIAGGPPEVDLGNLAVHLDLRVLQRGGDPDVEGRGRALLDRARRRFDLDDERLAAVCRHTWFRLACLSRCRRDDRHLVPALLARSSVVGGGLGGTGGR